MAGSWSLVFLFTRSDAFDYAGDCSANQEINLMDLNLTAEEEAFRRQVRDWLAANMPQGPLATREAREDKNWLSKAKEWPGKIYDGGVATRALANKYKAPAVVPVPEFSPDQETAAAPA